MNAIFRTAFVTSLVSYGLFFLFDVFRPGFVSYVFSVHLFLIPIVLFGVLWARSSTERPTPTGARAMIFTLVEFFIGFLLAIIVWKYGSVFGDFRLVAALVAIFIPTFLMRTI